MTPDPVTAVYGASLTAIETIEDALAEKLETENDDLDCAEARVQLTKALYAARSLRQHMEENFNFIGGVAEPKEEATNGEN